MIKKDLVLFRSPDLPRDFIETLWHKFNIFCIPVLVFTYSDFEQNLLSINFAEYEAIVFPSQRSVISLNRLSIRLPDNLKVFAVGEATAESCKCFFGKTPDIIGTKGAKQLCAEIIRNWPCSKLIYLCGDNQNTLPDEEFRSANIEVLEVLAYGTREANIEEIQKGISEVPVPDICIFFSPSGVTCVAKSLQLNWEKTCLVAIGATTAEALISTFKKCDFVPSEYNLTGIRKILMDY